MTWSLAIGAIIGAIAGAIMVRLSLVTLREAFAELRDGQDLLDKRTDGTYDEIHMAKAEIVRLRAHVDAEREWTHQAIAQLQADMTTYFKDAASHTQVQSLDRDLRTLAHSITRHP